MAGNAHTPERSVTGMGVEGWLAIGASIGLTFGIIYGNIAIGLALGIALGSTIGGALKALDAERESADRA